MLHEMEYIQWFNQLQKYRLLKTTIVKHYTTSCLRPKNSLSNVSQIKKKRHEVPYQNFVDIIQLLHDDMEISVNVSGLLSVPTLFSMTLKTDQGVCVCACIYISHTTGKLFNNQHLCQIQDIPSFCQKPSVCQ